MARKRTDVHRPTALVTEDYEFFACGYYGDHGEPGFSPMVTPMGQELLDQGWRFDDVNGGNCDHCGAHIKYYAIMKHLPSHRLIKIGEICLGNRFERSTAEFQRLRKEAKLDRERQRVIAAAAEWREEHEEIYQFLYDQIEEKNNQNDFLNSVWSALKKYGSLTERQTAAVEKFIARQAEWERKREEEKANEPEPTPVVEGNGEITGRIVSMKWQDSAYGGSMKMLVADDRGFRVWGTVPKAIMADVEHMYRENNEAKTYNDVLRHTAVRVNFKAAVKKSDRDDCFGFFSRPTSASVLTTEQMVMA